MNHFKRYYINVWLIIEHRNCFQFSCHEEQYDMHHYSVNECSCTYRLPINCYSRNISLPKYRNTWNKLFILRAAYERTVLGTHEDESTKLYKTKSTDGSKPNTNPNPNPNTNPIQSFYAFFQHRPLISSLALYCAYHTPMLMEDQNRSND